MIWDSKSHCIKLHHIYDTPRDLRIVRNYRNPGCQPSSILIIILSAKGQPSQAMSAKAGLSQSMESSVAVALENPTYFTRSEMALAGVSLPYRNHKAPVQIHQTCPAWEASEPPSGHFLPGLFLQSGQNHLTRLPGGSFRPTHSKWNHSRSH